MVAQRLFVDPDAASRLAAWCWILGIALCASVAVSQILLFIAALAALPALRRSGARLAVPPGGLLLAVFASWTLASALLSAAPRMALWESKEILLLGVPALGAALLDGRQAAERAGIAALAAGAALSLWGILEYTRGLPNPYERIRGPLSHHLTYAGIIMLLWVAAAAWCRSPFPALRRAALLALAPLGAALLLNQSRSAWLGAAAGLGTLAARGPRRPALALLAAAALVVGLHPGLRARAASLVDTAGDTSIEARRAMRRTGLRMIAEHPWFGTGPGGVPPAYARLQDSRYPLPLVQHLHSNLPQIAAERGIPAAAAWTAAWLLMAARLIPPAASIGPSPRRNPAADGPGRRGPGASLQALWGAQVSRPEMAPAALAGLAAFCVMGMFEYNFGDAEPSTLLLGLLALPFTGGAGARQ